MKTEKRNGAVGEKIIVTKLDKIEERNNLNRYKVGDVFTVNKADSDCIFIKVKGNSCIKNVIQILNGDYEVIVEEDQKENTIYVTETEKNHLDSLFKMNTETGFLNIILDPEILNDWYMDYYRINIQQTLLEMEYDKRIAIIQGAKWNVKNEIKKIDFAMVDSFNLELTKKNSNLRLELKEENSFAPLVYIKLKKDNFLSSNHFPSLSLTKDFYNYLESHFKNFGIEITYNNTGTTFWQSNFTIE